MKFKVSIIVPVYNSEDYIKDCVDSIRKQTYKNIEIILVNDGSKDNSGTICDELASQDSRIKVYHQTNLGPSASRNIGINLALGEYIQFVDSDDTIDSIMTENLIKAINESEMALAGYKTIQLGEGNNKISQNIIPNIQGRLTQQEFCNNFGLYYKQSLINSPCNKLYKTAIIKGNKIRFNEKINMGEDLLFNLDYIKICNFITVINDFSYNYKIYNNNNSLTTSFNINFFENQQLLFQKIKNFLIENNCYNQNNQNSIRDIYSDRIISSLENLLHKNNNLQSNEIKLEIKKIIYSKEVRRVIYYFRSGNIQKKILGQLIKKKSISGIYYYINIKNFIRNKMSRTFYLLKEFNNNKIQGK